VRALEWVKRLFRRPPEEEEYDHEDIEEAQRIRDRVEDIRMSNLGGSAGEYYESGRGQRH
jgi:hypothetical protein